MKKVSIAKNSYGWIRSDGSWLDASLLPHLKVAEDEGVKDPYAAGWLRVSLCEIGPVVKMTSKQFDAVVALYSGRELPFWLHDVEVT